MAFPRYAVYYAPARGSELAAFGNAWLGRNAETGEAIERPAVPGFSQALLEELTAAPAMYGFHGTLKPPFELAEGRTAEEFFGFAADFAAGLVPFAINGFGLKEIGGFLALVPKNGGAVAKLAERCLRAFDHFRAPPGMEELERRRMRGLPPRQERLLMRWGYPYVLEEFRFHLTLTCALRNAAMAKRIKKYLGVAAKPFRKAQQPVEELCLFVQRRPGAVFELTRRVPFDGAAGSKESG